MRQNQLIKDNLQKHSKQCQFLCDHLNEQDRRLVAGLLAMTIGWGGNTCVANIFGMDRETVAKGRRELHNELKDYPQGKQRLSGGGRKPLEKKVLKSSKRLKKSLPKTPGECRPESENSSD